MKNNEVFIGDGDPFCDERRARHRCKYSNRVNSDLIVWEVMAGSEISSFDIIAHLEHDSIGFFSAILIIRMQLAVDTSRIECAASIRHQPLALVSLRMNIYWNNEI